jgi:hypothetical protein
LVARNIGTPPVDLFFCNKHRRADARIELHRALSDGQQPKIARRSATL